MFSRYGSSRVVRAALPMLLALFAGGPVAMADVVIIGGLGNFDVRNDTGGECNEFEIELEGPHPEDVYHTYHNPNYGAPTITALPGNVGIRVVYSHPNHATQPNVIEHFGVSISAGHPVTAQRFAWKPGGLNPPFPPPPPPPPPPPLAVPRIEVEVYFLPGQGWMMRETLTNEDPLGRTIWVLRRETGVSREVQLEELMVNDPLIQGAQQIDAEPEKLEIGVPIIFDEDAPPPAELRSEVLIYECYANVELPGDDVPGERFSTVMSAAVAFGATCPPEFLPVITLHPVNVTVLLDGAVWLSVDATDPTGGELFFQWRHEGVDVPGADNALLEIDPAQLADAGAYTCQIRNDCGLVVTDAGYLTVLEPCSVIEQPQHAVACIGDTASFSVTFQGPQEDFIWRQRGAEIPLNEPRFVRTISADMRSSTLTIVGVRQSDFGGYDVMSDGGDCSGVLSSGAALVSLAVLPGDLNCDDSVDQIDLGILLSCWQQGPCGDLDGDDQTGQSDLGILLANWSGS